MEKIKTQKKQLNQYIKPNFLFLKADLDKICRRFNVKKLMSFGSVNTDKFSINSDIDILVKFGDSDKKDQSKTLRFGFKQAFVISMGYYGSIPKRCRVYPILEKLRAVGF